MLLHPAGKAEGSSTGLSLQPAVEPPQSKGNTRNRQGVVVGCRRSLTISSTKCKQASD